MAKKGPAARIEPSVAKRPAIAGTVVPRPTRVPTVAARDAHHSEHAVVWKVEVLDMDGPFGWGALKAAALPDVLQKIRQLETRRWVEIDGDSKRDHYISWDSLSPEAQKRLEELQLDDGKDLLFSLRLDGTMRIYGLRTNNVFCVLWWDPEHKVCPSHKKHT